MAVETGQAIITAADSRLIEDETLAGILGDSFGVYDTNTPPDPPLPYFRQRLVLNQSRLHGLHDYFLDLWYYGHDSAVARAAMDRVFQLFHEWCFMTANDEAQCVFWWFSGGFIPTDNPLIWHYATQWTVWVGAARDIANIVG